MCLTGNGATFALSALSGGATPPASVGRIISIGGIGGSVEEIEDSDLSSTLEEFCSGDLVKLSELTISVVFDPDVHVPIALGELGTKFAGTITFPLPEGQTTPGNLTGSGFIREGGGGDLENSSRSETELVWRFDNKSIPAAYTASA